MQINSQNLQFGMLLRLNSQGGNFGVPYMQKCSMTEKKLEDKYEPSISSSPIKEQIGPHTFHRERKDRHVYFFRLGDEPTHYIALDTPGEEDCQALWKVWEEMQNSPEGLKLTELAQKLETLAREIKTDSKSTDRDSALSVYQSYENISTEFGLKADASRMKFVHDRKHRIVDIDVDLASQDGVDPETAFYKPEN